MREFGPEWERKLHAAAQALTASPQTENSGAELLLDVLRLFVETGRQKIFSRDLAAILREGPDRLRSMALKQSDLNELKIAKLLRPYGIRPALMRIGTKVNKGYVGLDFRDALTRYVPRKDIDARMEESRRESELWEEAKAEEERIAAEEAAGEGAAVGKVEDRELRMEDGGEVKSEIEKAEGGNIEP